MRILPLLFLIILLFACRKTPANQEQKIFDRIAYVYSLKPIIAGNLWPGFDESQYDVPLVYYTDSSTFVANPTERFLNSFHSNLLFQKDKIKIYKTPARLDKTIFHMSTGFTMEDSAAYDNYAPFMHCSSYEETRKVIQDVSSTEEWATMVIHEYFHGFQFKHSKYLQSVVRNIFSIPQDSLRNLYKNYYWFKEKVDAENELLLLALETKSRTEADSLITAFFTLRQLRRRETLQKLGFDIEKYEAAYETIEGTARYVEQKLFEKFAHKVPDSNLIRSDTSYHSYRHFKNYNLVNDKWLYLTPKSAVYYYATGFNIARLLDKHHLKFKNRLFHEEKLSLENILKTM